MSQPSSSSYQAFELIRLLIQWRKTLIGIAVFAVIASSIVALLITPKFLSTVILYPTTNAGVASALQESTQKKDILSYGEEEEAEQLIQILQSDEIRTRVIAKYALMQHYEIDPEDPYKLTKLNKQFESNVDFTRTKYGSVRIDVLDESADTAALIANDIAALLDTVKNRMQQERAWTTFEVAKNAYDELLQHIKGLEDSLSWIGQKGVFDYEAQSEMYSIEYAKAVSKNDAGAVRRLEEKMSDLATYGGKQMALSLALEMEQEKLSLLKKRYNDAKVNATRALPHKYIVNHAHPAEKKAFPIRWLIVVISTISCTLLAYLFLLFKESFSRTNA